MFVYFTKENGTKRYVNPNLVEGIEVNGIHLIEGFIPINSEQYDEIMAQLDALGLLYKPSEPLPDVGEPLREIVGSRLMHFMNTKGRTD
jgi:uncharacterized protein YlzI (FlbEa/FlbD family)